MTVVLVVDDEDDIRLLSRLTLERAGVTVLEASSGEEALSVLARCAVDVMVLDLRMPGLDGWGVLDRLSGTDRVPQLRIIVTSAHADPVISAAARERGGGSYLSKPFAPASLVRAVIEG